MESARVIIADVKTGVFNALVKMYQLTPHKYIESLEWVERCVERQDVIFTPHVFKNPGGRRAGEEGGISEDYGSGYAGTLRYLLYE